MGGAFVGATAGGLVDWFFNYRRERDLARAGARLVAADLAKADRQIRVAEETRKWSLEDLLPTSSWLEYKAILAVRLDKTDFEVVSRMVTLLKELDEIPSLENEAPLSYHTFVNSETFAGLSVVRDELAVAYNALAGIGDLDRIGTRIAEP